MPRRFLIYNFLGRAHDISDLFPNERFATFAAILSAAGHAVEIRDGANAETLADYPQAIVNDVERLHLHDTDTSAEYENLLHKESQLIAAGEFDLIFLNLWRGPGFRFTIHLAAELKRILPDIPLVGIGQSIDWLRESVLELAPALDAILYGLGYTAVRKLAQGEVLEELPNAVLRGESGLRFTRRVVEDDLDTLPLPRYEANVYKGIDGKIPVYPVALSNEACPHACPYCVRPASYGTDIRKKSLHGVVMEIRRLFDAHGVRHFRIADSTPPPGALTTLARELIKEGLDERKIVFSGFSRLDTGSAEDFALLKHAGMVSVFFGVETLDEENQRRIRKKIAFPQIRETLRSAHEAGLYTVASLIVPLPGETEASMQNTLVRLRELKPWLDSVIVNPAGVYPNTEWRAQPEANGIRLAADYDSVAPAYPIKFIQPLRYWPPFPFTYDLMGKCADQVSFQDIVSVFERFLGTVARGLGIDLLVRDYDIVAGRLLGISPRALVQEISRHFVEGNAKAVQELVRRARSSAADTKKSSSLQRDVTPSKAETETYT